MQTNPEITMMIRRSMQVTDRRTRLNRSLRPATPSLFASIRAIAGSALIAIGERIAPTAERGTAAGVSPRIGRADI